MLGKLYILNSNFYSFPFICFSPSVIIVIIIVNAFHITEVMNSKCTICIALFFSCLLYYVFKILSKK